MTSLRKWTGICAVLLFVAALVSGMAVAQEPKGDAKEQDAKMVEGTLMDIDQTARVLTLKTGDDEMQISYNEKTEMVVPETDGKPPVVHQGTKMRVHYTEREKAKMATKIEIIETTAAH